MKHLPLRALPLMVSVALCATFVWGAGTPVSAGGLEPLVPRPVPMVIDDNSRWQGGKLGKTPKAPAPPQSSFVRNQSAYQSSGGQTQVLSSGGVFVLRYDRVSDCCCEPDVHEKTIIQY